MMFLPFGAFLSIEFLRIRYTVFNTLTLKNIIPILLSPIVFGIVPSLLEIFKKLILSIRIAFLYFSFKLKLGSLQIYYLVLFSFKSWNRGFSDSINESTGSLQAVDEKKSLKIPSPIKKSSKDDKNSSKKNKSSNNKTIPLITAWQEKIGISLMKSKNNPNGIFPRGVIALSEKDVDVLSEVLSTRVPNEKRTAYDAALLKSLIVENIKFFNELVINNNVTIGPGIYKAVWTSVLARFRGSEFAQVKGVSYSSSNKIPSKLSSLNVFFNLIKHEGICKDTLFVFHILESVYATYKLPTELPEFSTESITNKMTKSEYSFVNSMSIEFRSFLKDHPISKDISTQWENEMESLSRQYKLSGKSGPNGNAIQTMLLDAYVLKHNSKLFTSFEKMCKHLNRKDLIVSVNTYSELYEQQNPNFDSSKAKIAKVTQVPEKGNKNRVVAIQNFWIQQPMNIIRQLIDKVITKHYVRNDACFMYNHFGSLTKAIKSYSLTGYSISFDLSNASDRIPRIYQRDVLSSYVNPRFAQDYFELVSFIDFSTSNGEIINYEVGQPMGSYESFNLFQCFLMELWRFSAHKTIGTNDVKEVCKYFSTVGDDNQGFNLDMSNYWRNFLESSGCSISLTKTIGKVNDIQWFTTCSLIGAVDEHGSSVNLSPVSVSLLNNAVSDFREIPYLINDLVSRGYTIEQIAPLFSENGCFYKQLIRTNKQGITYLQLLAEFTYCTFDGTKTLAELLSDQPNRLKDIGFTPEIMDNFKIIFLLIRAIDAVRNKMTTIEQTYLRLFPDFDESTGEDRNDLGVKINVLNGINTDDLYPGNIPEVLRPMFKTSDDGSHQLIDELIVIQSVNIVKSISKLSQSSIEDQLDIENLTSQLTALDTDFKVILNRKESRLRFNTYPVHNIIINDSIKSNEDSHPCDIKTIKVSEETTLDYSVSEENILCICIHTKSPQLFRFITKSINILKNVDLKVNIII